MDEILAAEPSEFKETLPDGQESDSPSENGADADVKTEGEMPEVEAKAEAKPKAEAKSDDGEDEGPDPTDVAGYKKALAAARGDKRKYRKQWQEADRKFAEIEGRAKAQAEMLAALQQQKQQPEKKPEEKPDPFNRLIEEPEGFVNSMVEPKLMKHWLSASEYQARKQYEDYSEAEAAFFKAANQMPSLLAEIERAPWAAGDYVYNTGKQILTHGQQQSEVEQYKARIAELEAAQSGSSTNAASVTTPAAKPIPKTIAASRGNGASAKQSWAGPRSLDEILA
jgi:hypothetical protein